MSDAPFRVAGLTIIAEYWGEESDDFLVHAHCELVRDGEPSGGAFNVYIAGPRHLDREIPSEDGAVYGRGYLFMRDYDEPLAIARLQKLIDGGRASTWQELEAFVSRYFEWVVDSGLA